MKDKSLVETIFTKSKHLSTPTLLKFQNGTLLTNRKEHTLFTKVSTKNDQKSAVVLLDNHIYEGPIKDNDEFTDLYICVRNKTTNKVRIIPIEQAELTNNVFKRVEQISKPELSDAERFRTLLTQFGGRKAARIVNSQQQLKLDIDLMKENLDQTVEDITSVLDESADEPRDDQNYLDTIRVKFNPDATTVDEVYDINDVIPEELLDRLDEEANVLRKTPTEQIPIKSDYLRKELDKAINSNKSDEEINQKIKMILYMDALRNLLKARIRFLNKIQLSDVTEKVETDIRQRFCDKNCKGVMRTTFSTEKSLCHFIVLALLLSDKHEVDIKTLQEELTTVRAKILRFGHVVNALPTKQSTVLTLRLPSNVPPLSKVFGRRKRKIQ